MSAGADDPTRERLFFVARLWRGRISLAATFWLYGAVVVVLLYASASGLVDLLVWRTSAQINPRALLLIVLFAVALRAAYAAFITIAIWRSASHYAAQFPKRKFNAILAKIYAVCDIVYFAAKLILFVRELSRIDFGVGS